MDRGGRVGSTGGMVVGGAGLMGGHKQLNVSITEREEELFDEFVYGLYSRDLPTNRY